jgi:hypothetical protein
VPRSQRSDDMPPHSPASDTPGSSSNAKLKYPSPKILVIDAPDVPRALQQRGYCATSGSFGQPVLVTKGPGYLPVPKTASLPGYTEQEIVVVDLVGPDPRSADDSPEMPVAGERAVWAPTKTGLIDPRPGVMRGVRSDMDRIYKHGGIFIIFATARFDPSYIINSIDPYGHLDRYEARPFEADNWSLLSRLQGLPVSADIGQEMDPASNGIARNLGIDDYFKAGHFECVVGPSSSGAGQWVSLAMSKYGDPVAGIILPGEGTTEGLIFVFPRIERRADLVVELIDRVLPELRPRLFPHAEGGRWVRRPEYDLPRANELRIEIAKIEEETRRQVRDLEEQIQAERTQFKFLYDLITATGDDLVQAVIRTLEVIGFTEVEDVDAEGSAGPLREDVRIMGIPVPILVEVKGIVGLPREASSLQVAKYLAPRMRECGRTDLHGLAIINHQRNLPGLDRDNDNVFQKDVISNAEQQGFGLLTAWDLFRLARGYLRHGWHHDDIAGLFVISGRIHPVPRHYELIGAVDEYWAKAAALGLRLKSGTLRVGDRVAYEGAVDFIEEVVTSLRLDGQEIDVASTGQHIGVKTILSKSQARRETCVYRVASRQPGVD